MVDGKKGTSLRHSRKKNLNNFSKKPKNNKVQCCVTGTQKYTILRLIKMEEVLTF
jgi:hypothetical protein